METIAFLGASRGLGRQVCWAAQDVIDVEFSLLAARNKDNLEITAEPLKKPYKIMSVDFSKRENLEGLLDEIRMQKIKRVFYFAAGGPYGLFHTKEWKDHLWGLQVSFLTPSEILHQILRDSSFSCVEQIIFVGSLIADHKPDPNAASYSSAKHGLKGMVESILAEGCDKDLRFFRPGYMDTEMLPSGAPPRQDGPSLLDPQIVAKKFVQWAFNPQGPKILDEP